MTPEYRSWRQMRARCLNKNAWNYRNYGGRGIRICERWNDYVLFLADMGRKPTPPHTLDRINNAGNYEPGNCRWATPKEQRRNCRQKVHFLEYNGERRTLVEWARVVGMNEDTLENRFRLGWTAEEIFTTPLQKRHYTTPEEKVGIREMVRAGGRSISAIARHFGVDRATVRLYGELASPRQSQQASV